MKRQKRIFISVNALYGLMVLFFLLDLFQILEAKGEYFKSIIHVGTILSTPIILVCNLMVFKIRKWELLFYTSSLVLMTFFYLVVSQVGLLGYLFSIESYQTQTILYENTYCGFRTIEFQMKDLGARGFDRRYVEVTYLTPCFMITKEVDPDKNPGEGWIKVDEQRTVL